MTVRVNDFVRCYDFEPRPNIGHRYVEGWVTKIEGHIMTVKVTKDTCSPDRPREEISTGLPGKMAFMEWDGRVTVLDLGTHKF
jgi:hypothetical protein